MLSRKSFKPQAGKAGIISGKKDRAKGRVVMVYIMHVCFLLVVSAFIVPQEGLFFHSISLPHSHIAARQDDAVGPKEDQVESGDKPNRCQRKCRTKEHQDPKGQADAVEDQSGIVHPVS